MSILFIKDGKLFRKQFKKKESLEPWLLENERFIEVFEKSSLSTENEFMIERKDN